MRARAPLIILTLFTSFLLPVLIGNVYAASCPPGNCQVTVNSNVPSADGTIYIQIDNGTGTYCGSNPCTVALRQSSPPTFSFPYNSTHTLTVLNSTFTGASTNGHYVWKDWENYYGLSACNNGPCVWTTNPTVRICPANSCNPNGVIFNYTSVAGLTAVFDRQYPATLSFTDAVGNPLTGVPNNVTLQGQTTGPMTINSYNSRLTTADKYTVTKAYWEGIYIYPYNPAQTIDLTSGPATTTISLKAYPAIVQIVDTNNNPVKGANVTITYVNATVRSYLSNSKGQVNLGDVPLGSFGVTVSYQNQAYGPYTPNVVGSPTYTIQVNGGSTTTTTSTAIVLLAIFGIAFFLILLAIKVRRPAPPPKI